ncbi:hypothetical protein CDAR_441081 [Caerostris darwini]|uniref:Uncharacterized protein n=1 Tax=Caerostris darwini TaxID=1538125 RepID=A0AAV4Q6Z5_9ARAC|nr:hypothetical protein CDAR_441081 [Caerostris darwini]
MDHSHPPERQYCPNPVKVMSELFEFQIENGTQEGKVPSHQKITQYYSLCSSQFRLGHCVSVMGWDGVHWRTDELSCTSVSALLLFLFVLTHSLCLFGGGGDDLIRIGEVSCCHYFT